MQEPTKYLLDGSWLFKVDSLEKGVAATWFQDGLDRSDWQEVTVPGYWDRYNLSGYDGVGWFAKSFDWNDTLEDRVVFFGGVDDDADVWMNGQKVGSHEGYSEDFFFDISKALRKGKNDLVVRVNDRGGPGGIYKPVTVVRKEEIEGLLKSKYADEYARPSADWVRDAVIYEVFVRSFSREGTFRALEKRVPELKNLGVTVLWLMPIHPVGELNRKGSLGSPYAVQDYYGINPEFGTIEDFRSLVKTVHDNGLKIIIDLVANHTAWDNNLVQEHPDWFTRNEDGHIVAPNADWSDVADLNYDSHELRKYMIQMMEYWVREIGIDGYRCDVAELVPTDFWEVARGQLDKLKPVMMLSEGTFPEHHVRAFDLTYSWNFYDALDKVIKGSTPVSIFDDLVRNESYKFPKRSLRMRFNTNHDKNAGEAPAVKKYSVEGAKATAVLMFTYPGVPLVYNGEEAGNDKRLDLFEKVDIDWSKNRNFHELYSSLGSLRARYASLRIGEYKSVLNSDAQRVYSFGRRLEREQVIVVVNLSKVDKAVEVDLGTQGIESVREYFSSSRPKLISGKLKDRLGPFGYKVYISE